MTERRPQRRRPDTVTPSSGTAATGGTGQPAACRLNQKHSLAEATVVEQISLLEDVARVVVSIVAGGRPLCRTEYSSLPS